MVRGFYTLGSGMLTQTRKLTAISNNLANAETPGYKRNVVSASTFGQMVISRLDSQATPIGSMNLATVADRTDVIHSQGGLKDTGRSLDFAIKGEGFFAVQGNGGTLYTRDGSFNVDANGYLVLDGMGRVLGRDGRPIRPGTDQITADSEGNLFAGGNPVGSLAVVNFANYNSLKPAGENAYTAAGGAALMQNPAVLWKTTEGSNVDEAQEMTNAVASQRELQTCSQALKMYDQILSMAVTDIAKV